jgi:hypothetical protein
MRSPTVSSLDKRRRQTAARMRGLRRRRRVGLLRVEFLVSRTKLRKLTAARENIADSEVLRLPDKLLIESLMRSVAFTARLWLRRYAARS